MINGIATIGKYIIPSALITLDNVQTTAISSGELISDGKVSISGISVDYSGLVRLREVELTQVKTAGTLNLTDMDLYIFQNDDTLGLNSGDTFALSATNEITDIKYMELVTADWHTVDSNNCIIQKTDLNLLFEIETETSKSLSFSLIARASATFDNHTLKARFYFEQVIK